MSNVNQSFTDTVNNSTEVVTKFIESPTYRELLKQINYINKVYQEILIILGPQMRRIMEIYQEMVERILPFIVEISNESAQTFTSVESVSIPSSPIIEDDIVPRAPPLTFIMLYIAINQFVLKAAKFVVCGCLSIVGSYLCLKVVDASHAKELIDYLFSLMDVL